MILQLQLHRNGLGERNKKTGSLFSSSTVKLHSLLFKGQGPGNITRDNYIMWDDNVTACEPKQGKRGTRCERTLESGSLLLPLKRYRGGDMQGINGKKGCSFFSPQLFQQKMYLLWKDETSDRTQVSFRHHCAWLRTAVGWYEIIRLVISVTKKEKENAFISTTRSLSKY